MIATLCCCCCFTPRTYKYSYSLFNIGLSTLILKRNYHTGMTVISGVTFQNLNNTALNPNTIRVRDYQELEKSFTIDFEPFFDSVILPSAISSYPVYDEDFYFCNYGEYTTIRYYEDYYRNVPFSTLTTTDTYFYVDVILPYWVQPFGRYYEFTITTAVYDGLSSIGLGNFKDIYEPILSNDIGCKVAYGYGLTLDAIKLLLFREDVTVDYIFSVKYNLDTNVQELIYAKI